MKKKNASTVDKNAIRTGIPSAKIDNFANT